MNPTDLAAQLIERMTGIGAGEWDGHRFGPMLRDQCRRMAADDALMTLAAADMDAAVAQEREAAREHVRAAVAAITSPADKAA